AHSLPPALHSFPTRRSSDLHRCALGHHQTHLRDGIHVIQCCLPHRLGSAVGHDDSRSQRDAAHETGVVDDGDRPFTTPHHDGGIGSVDTTCVKPSASHLELRDGHPAHGV